MHACAQLLIIVFREVIEAGLVVGIVLAASASGVPRRGLWVGYGIAGGIAGACLVAAFAGSISSGDGRCRPGIIQRRHPAGRRAYADLA